MNDTIDTPTPLAEPQPAVEDRLRTHALAEAERLEAEAKVLWDELKRIEVEIQPHIDRADQARHKWCAVHTRVAALRELCPGGGL